MHVNGGSAAFNPNKDKQSLIAFDFGAWGDIVHCSGPHQGQRHNDNPYIDRFTIRLGDVSVRGLTVSREKTACVPFFPDMRKPRGGPGVWGLSTLIAEA